MATKAKRATLAEKVGKFLHSYMEKHGHPASPDFVDTLTEMIVEDDLLPEDGEQAKQFMAKLVDRAESFTMDGARDVLDRAMGQVIEEDGHADTILQQLKAGIPEFVPDETVEQWAAEGPSPRLALKMLRAAEKMPNIPKTKYNKAFQFHYAGVEAIVSIVRLILASEGIAFFAGAPYSETHETTSKQGGKMYHSNVRVRFYFIDAEDGSSISCDFVGEAIDSQDKSISKAIRSATKYFLITTFLLEIGEPEADGS